MQIKKISGFLNLMVTNKGRYYHTINDLNEMYQSDPDSHYSPRDLSNMIFDYMLGFAIDGTRYHNCSQVIRKSRSRSMDVLQEVAELLAAVPLTSYPVDNYAHWTMAEFILAYQLDLHALIAAGDEHPDYAHGGGAIQGTPFVGTAN